MADLHVDFLGKRLAGPVIAASGTFGFGPEYADIEDLRVLRQGSDPQRSARQ